MSDLAPDYEDRHLLAIALLHHLGVNADQVQLDSLTITISDDNHHAVSWTGHAHITTTQLTDLARHADAHADAR